MSRKKWATPSADLKKSVRAESGEKMARRVGKAADTAEAEAAELLQSKKITEVTAGSAFMKELRSGAKPIVDDWIMQAKSIGVDGEAAIAEYKGSVKSLMK